MLHHASGSPGPLPAAGPGGLWAVTPGQAPTVIANCLSRPTLMRLDAKVSIVYANELTTGRLVAIPVP